MNYSMEEDKVNDGSEEIDEMFLVNQMKTQYVIRTMRILRFI